MPPVPATLELDEPPPALPPVWAGLACLNTSSGAPQAPNIRPATTAERSKPKYTSPSPSALAAAHRHTAIRPVATIRGRHRLRLCLFSIITYKSTLRTPQTGNAKSTRRQIGVRLTTLSHSLVAQTESLERDQSAQRYSRARPLHQLAVQAEGLSACLRRKNEPCAAIGTHHSRRRAAVAQSE